MSMTPRAVIKRSLDGQVLEVYPSVLAAAKAEGVIPSTLRAWCYGCIPKEKKDYTFEFISNQTTASGKPQTLCWKCARAVKGCSWSREFKPVEGWTAEPTILEAHYEGARPIRSYHVSDCPEFIPDQER